MVIHYCMESQSSSITQLLKPRIAQPRGFELAGLYCIYAFGMSMERLATETMMDKARTVTDTKLCREKTQIKEIYVLLPFV